MTSSNENRYPLLEIQKRLLYEYLGNLRFDNNQTKIVIRLEKPMEPKRGEAAWRRTIEKHPILRTRFVWKTENPYQEILPIQACPLNFRVSEKSCESYDEVFLELDHTKVDTDENTFHCILFNRSQYFLGFVLLPVLMDGWSISMVIQDFLQQYYAPATADVRTTVSYEEVLSMLVRRPTAVGAFQNEIRDYLYDLDKPCMVANYDKHYGGFIRYESTFDIGLIERVKQFCGAKNMMTSVLIYAVWALVLYRYFEYNTISFGTTFSNRGNEIPLDIAGQFIRTVPLIRKMNQKEEIAHMLNDIKNDLINKLTGPDLSLWDYVSLRKFSAPLLFDSLVVIENYPMMQQKYKEVIDFKVLEKAEFNMVLGVFLNQGRFVLQYHNAHFKVDQIRALSRLINDYLYAIVNGNLTYIGDIL